MDNPKIASGDDPPPGLWGEAGTPVPTVDPEDVKAVFTLQQEVQAQNPGKNGMIGMRVVERVCKPGADLKSVCYRTNFLSLWQRVNPGELVPWTHDGIPDDTLFRAIARVNMKWMAIGGGQQDPPFDEKEFFQIVRGGG